MRSFLRHSIALLFLGFFCRLALQAQDSREPSDVPKALLLARVAPSEALPSRPIDPRPVIAAILRE